jgi:hypothetical protein
MKHMVVVYEIEDDAVVEFPETQGVKVKSCHMTWGRTVRQVGTGEEAFIPYASWFDEKSSTAFMANEEYNWLFLRQQQNWANDMLYARGHLFLNELLAMLGMAHATMGAVVGWTYSKDTDKNLVDFGCWAQEATPLSDAKPGAILLMFNVQGPILHTLG